MEVLQELVGSADRFQAGFSISGRYETRDHGPFASPCGPLSENRHHVQFLCIASRVDGTARSGFGLRELVLPGLTLGPGRQAPAPVSHSHYGHSSRLAQCLTNSRVKLAERALEFVAHFMNP